MTTRRRARRGSQRGESSLWSVAMITACVMLIGVVVVTLWVSQRGGRIGETQLALAGIARYVHGEPPVAAAATADPTASASAEPSAAPSAEPTANVAATDARTPDAGDAEEEEEEPDAAVAAGPKVTPQSPSKAASAPKKKKPRKKRHY